MNETGKRWECVGEADTEAEANAIKDRHAQHHKFCDSFIGKVKMDPNQRPA